MWLWSISLCFCRCDLLENAWEQDEHGKVGVVFFAVGADPTGMATCGIIEVVDVRDVLIRTGCNGVRVRSVVGDAFDCVEFGVAPAVRAGVEMPDFVTCEQRDEEEDHL